MNQDQIRLLVLAAREYLDSIQYYFAKEEVSVHAVEQADQLVEALRRAKPTVIAIDCVSPQINGAAALGWLRTEGGAGDIPALLITAGKSQHNLSDTGATAPVEFVALPLQQADFVDRVRALHRAGAHGVARP